MQQLHRAAAKMAAQACIVKDVLPAALAQSTRAFVEKST